MRKNNPKYKKWLKRRLNHLEKKRKKNNKKGRYAGVPASHVYSQTKINGHEKYGVTAPQNFSIKDNPQEVSNFFDQIVKFTNSRQKDTDIYFDLSNIETISADAIIYLIATIKDLQKLGFSHHNFYGNLPINKTAKEYFIQSGFLDYVNTKIPKEYSNSKCIQIISNDRYDQLATKKICDFVIANTEMNRQDIKYLYVLINEMMLNTCQHAYESNSRKFNRWYLFAQNDNNILKFTFLDVGLGIPKTVQKKLYERIWPNEASIIESALNGEFRTITKKEFRGKGLPKIKECVIEHKLNNFTIISNRAFCRLINNKESYIIEKGDMTKPIFGTTYYWEINTN